MDSRFLDVVAIPHLDAQIRPACCLLSNIYARLVTQITEFQENGADKTNFYSHHD